MPDDISRREFATAMAVVAGVALLPATGCAKSTTAPARTVETPSSSYGEDVGMGAVLVGYATRNGSTVEVAEEIGRTLGARGYSVSLQPMAEVASLEGYDAVVLGSAINGGRWLPEAREYADAHASELTAVPLAVFCVHAMNTGAGERKRERRLAYINDIREQLSPAEEGFFAGTGLDPDDTSAFTRWMFKLFGGDVEGDGRDWDAIREWAGGLRLSA